MNNTNKWLLIVCLTCFPMTEILAFEFDWDGSIGKGEHKYVPAISNPLFNETPHITTEIRPIMIHQSIDNQNVLGTQLFGGDIDLIAAEIRVALTDNLGFIATKDGYAWIDFNDATNAIGIDDPEGFANFSLGFKYALWNDIADQSIFTVGIEYEMPTGGLSIDTPLAHPLDNVDLNQSGDGFLDIFVTGEKRFGKFGLQSNVGANIAIDGDHDSSMIHYSFHADYEFTEHLYPMLEFNGFTIYDDGNRTPLDFDGVDLVNLGCTTCGTVLTVAGGMRIVATDNIMFGMAIEKSLARDDLLDWRGYLDMIVHF